MTKEDEWKKYYIDELKNFSEVCYNRMCKNCRFYENYECQVIDDWDCYNDEPAQWTPPSEDFGCNKFKKK